MLVVDICLFLCLHMRVHDGQWLQIEVDMPPHVMACTRTPAASPTILVHVHHIMTMLHSIKQLNTGLLLLGMSCNDHVCRLYGR